MSNSNTTHRDYQMKRHIPNIPPQTCTVSKLKRMFLGKLLTWIKCDHILQTTLILNYLCKLNLKNLCDHYIKSALVVINSTRRIYVKKSINLSFRPPIKPPLTFPSVVNACIQRNKHFEEHINLQRSYISI